MKQSFPNIIYAINEKILGRDTLSYFTEFKKIEHLSLGELKDLQFKKLKALLSHAYDSTEYYKEIFDKAGFDPGEMRCLDDLEKVPFLTKGDIKNNIDRLISKDRKRRLTRYATSGSTGHPLIFYLSNERIAANKAAYLILYGWWGLEIGDREVVLWGSSHDILAYSVLKKMRDRLLRTHLLPAFRLGERDMYKYISFIQKYRPKDIFGYAHSIYLLTRFANNRNLKLDDIGIRVVFTTAELLHDFQRELIEKVFGCHVSNCYGGRESGLIAFECPKGNMHLNPNIVTEFIKNGSRVAPGEIGEITITDPDSYGMPFIRYRTGDEGILGEAGQCACGKNFPVIKKIVGRDTDYVVNSRGEFIHPLALEYIFRDLDGIDYFKIVQKKEGALMIDLAINNRFNKGLEGSIKYKICQVMGEDVTVTFSYIKEGEMKTDNKYKFVVSEIFHKYV